MRVGTLTFHWASNYGAIMQAYALQRFLVKQGFETLIIDYVPRRVVIIRLVQRLIRRDRVEFARERRMRRFRKKHLLLTPRKYRTRVALGRVAGDFDVFISGSDQIWNEWFTLHAEGRPTLSYLLDFVGISAKRVSYAASFGTDRLSAEAEHVMATCLAEFDAVSVRETSGAEIVNRMGLSAEVVVDPTLLLGAEDYDELLAEGSTKPVPPFLTYVLHGEQTTATRVCEYVSAQQFGGRRGSGVGGISVTRWLARLKNAEFVVTNSFHGAVFCLIFHRPFIVVAVEGIGDSMNGRFMTLLSAVGLNERMVETFDSAQIDQLLSTDVDWAGVDVALGALRTKSAGFLLSALHAAGVASSSPRD